MQKFAKLYKGYKYLLTCIDVFSKYAWVIVVKYSLLSFAPPTK